jgi:hypothetical protein
MSSGTNSKWRATVGGQLALEIGTMVHAEDGDRILDAYRLYWRMIKTPNLNI